MPPKKLSPTAPEFVPKEQELLGKDLTKALNFEKTEEDEKQEGLIGKDLMKKINMGGKSRKRRSKKTKRTRTRRHR
jgi:hypothetical protein